MTVKTNLGLIEWAKVWLGQAYWYGCCCYPCTQNLLTRKAKQYPKSYAENRMSRYRSDIAAGKKCADCIGLIKGYYWTRDDGTQVYGLDGRPDQGANGAYKAAKVKGAIASLPTARLILGKAVMWGLLGKARPLKPRVSAMAL